MTRAINRVKGVQHANHHETNMTELELLEQTEKELLSGDNNYETYSNLQQVRLRMAFLKQGQAVFMKGGEQ